MPKKTEIDRDLEVKYNGLPLFILNADTPKNVIEGVSFVESPAMEADFFKFGKESPKNVVWGVALRPNKPIYRNQNGQEFYVQFTKTGIYDYVYNNVTLSDLYFNFNHIAEKKYNCKVVESYIIDRSVNKMPPIGYENESDGTWLLGVKVNDPYLLEKIDTGEAKGFSLEVSATATPATEYDLVIAEINNYLLNNSQ